MVPTVLIAAPEHLQPLKDHFPDALAFSDADALKALEAISREKPPSVILEKLFAATSRGAALIKRIKADPSLIGCEIKIVSQDGKQLTAKKKKEDGSPSAEVSSHEQTATAAEPTPATAPAVAASVSAAAVESAAPLDQRGTRRAPRFSVTKGIEVLIDGKPAALIDLSQVGAQVVSPTILRPNQRVRLTLPDADGAIRVNAAVAWAAFEMPKSGPVYRAGIEFYDAEAGNLDRYIDKNKAG